MHFGVCPYCALTDGHLNVESGHFYVCHQHRVKWFVGNNLFSDWRRESERKWLKNQKLLATYKEMKPVFVIYNLFDPLKGPEPDPMPTPEQVADANRMMAEGMAKFLKRDGWVPVFDEDRNVSQETTAIFDELDCDNIRVN
jgi:hypothetical protein